MSGVLEALGPAPRLHHESYMPETAEEAVCIAYKRALRLAVGEEVLQEDFSAERALARLPLAIDEATPDILSRTLDAERQRLHEPLHDFLGRQALSNEVARDMRPPLAYVSGLKAQVDELPRDLFTPLEVFHDQVSRTPYLSLVRSVHRLAGSQSPDWADEAYDLVRTATTEHFKDYALPEGEEEALYLVCFVPGKSRGLTRRLTANATHMAAIERRLGQEITEDEQVTLDALTGFMKTEVSTGQHWTDLPLSESTLQSTALVGAEALGHLGVIQEKTRDGTGRRVAEAWRETARELSDRVERSAVELGIYDWASQDTGHCFEKFAEWGLFAAFRMGAYTEVGYNALPAKDGSVAVILEDDPAQMRAWQDVVSRHFPQVTDEAHQFSTPEKVADTAADPNASLFLLDIQNGDDETAGIRVAESILRQRYAIQEAAGGDPATVPRTEIIVWSSSQAAVRAASDYFKPIIMGMSNVSFKLVGSGGSTSSNKINIEIRPKGWSFTDLKFEAAK